jgi:zinc transporter ZupT
MSTIATGFIIAIVSLLTALAAGSFPLWKKISEQQNLLNWLTGLAAGILLASALLVAIPEGFELSSDEPLHLGAAILCGFLFMLILEGFGFGHDVHEEHHDHSDEHDHDHIHHVTGSSLVFGLSIHALTDGLAIGAAISSQSEILTLTLTAAVIAHKIPAAFSLGVFSMHERGNRKAALKDLLLFSLATPIAIMLSIFFLGDLEVNRLALAVLFAAGTFLYVATVDVLPDVHSPETGKQALLQVIIGAGIMLLFLLALDASGIISHSH